MVQKKPKISVLIVNYKQKTLVEKIFKAVKVILKKDFEFLVFNNSQESIIIPSVRVYSKRKNVGYAKAINYLSKKARGNIFLILNPDSAILSNFKKLLTVFAKDSRVGVISLSKTNNILYSVPLLQKFFRIKHRFSSCAFLIRADVFKKLKGFDERFFMYFEDDDLALKLQKYNIKTYTPKKEFIYHEKLYNNTTNLKRKLYYSKSLFYFLNKNHFLASLFFSPFILIRISLLKVFMKIDNFLYGLLAFFYIVGLYPNAIFFTFNRTLPIIFLDLAMFLIFLRSIYIRKKMKIYHFFKVIDSLILLVFFVNLLLLFFNYFNYLFSFTSVFYLFRLIIYLSSYVFFVSFFKNNYKSIFSSLYKLINFILLLNLGVFLIFPNLNIKTFDPHIYRLYGQFLDPNFYGVFLVIALCFSLFYAKKVKRVLPLYITTSLTLLSLFLTFSRLALILLIVSVILLFIKDKKLYYLTVLLGFSLLVITNYDFLIRLLFVEGNYQSFLFRVQNFFEGLFIYNSNIIATGFNNISIYNYYLNSVTSNSTSYFSFFPNTLVVSSGIFGSVFLSIFIYFMLLKKEVFLSYSYLLIFLILFSSFFINVFFSPMFLIFLPIICGLCLVLFI